VGSPQHGRKGGGSVRWSRRSREWPRRPSRPSRTATPSPSTPKGRVVPCAVGSSTACRMETWILSTSLCTLSWRAVPLDEQQCRVVLEVGGLVVE
jgi:hypothetical protein